MANSIDRRGFFSHAALAGAAAASLHTMITKNADGQDNSKDEGTFVWRKVNLENNADVNECVELMQATSPKYSELTRRRLKKWLKATAGEKRELWGYYRQLCSAEEPVYLLRKTFAVRYKEAGTDFRLGPLGSDDRKNLLNKPKKIKKAIQPFYEKFAALQAAEEDWLIDHIPADGDSPLTIMFSFVKNGRFPIPEAPKLIIKYVQNGNYTRTYLTVKPTT